MDKGIFDRIFAFLSPESPLRSDRVTGGFVAALGLLFMALGVDWTPEQQGEFVSLWTRTLDALNALVALGGAWVAYIGFIRSKVSARKFCIPLIAGGLLFGNVACAFSAWPPRIAVGTAYTCDEVETKTLPDGTVTVTEGNCAVGGEISKQGAEMITGVVEKAAELPRRAAAKVIGAELEPAP